MSKRKLDKRNVLIIPDTHFPFEREGILEHCLEVQQKWNCGSVIHSGDEVDLCAVSQFEHDPDGMSIGSEYAAALASMKQWYKAFPEVNVCIGNHSSRIFRLARTAGLSTKFIKSYEEIWEAPKGWKWAEKWEYLDVLYTHGPGLSGQNAALTLAMQYRQNVVIGHLHSVAGVSYSASSKDLVWGMCVGGALDDNCYAAAYAKDQIKKSIVGCGVVLNGQLPLFLPMNL